MIENLNWLHIYFYSVGWTFITNICTTIIADKNSIKPIEFRVLDAIVGSIFPILNILLLIGNIRQIYLTFLESNNKVAKFHFSITEQNNNINLDDFKEPEEGFDPVTGAYWDPIARTWCDPELVPNHIHRKFKNKFGNFKKR